MPVQTATARAPHFVLPRQKSAATSSGVHWSLALSAMILLAVTIALFALVIPARRSAVLGD